MNKFKEWIRRNIFELLKSDIEYMFFKLMLDKHMDIQANEVNNSNDDLRVQPDTQLSSLIGSNIEIKHCNQEESIFINVDAVIESSSYMKNNDTGEVICKSKKVIFIDVDKTVYNLDNIYEYEIRKEVLYK